MWKVWRSLAIGVAISLAVLGSAAAEEAAWNEEEAVLAEQARAGYEGLDAELKIDLLRALVARGALLDAMDELPAADGEAVLGEQARADEVDYAVLQDMLTALMARARMDAEMAALP